MPIHPLVGHDEAREQVAGAIRREVLPQTLLIVGPEGVGKQRFALWVAQRLLCQRPGDREPCGECNSCRKTLGLAHPDVHWFVPIQRPKGGEPDKQLDEAAETLADVMEERRHQPLWLAPDGMWSHGIPSVRLLLRRVALTPVEGRKKVVLVGDAERLIAQAGAEDAANALLKALEEPPADTVFLLTAEDPRRLLPTIQSRAVVLRLGRLTDEAVRGFLAAHLQPKPAAAALSARVAAAEGSIGAALAEDGSGQKHRDAATSVIEAALAGAGEQYERALRQPPYQARGDFAGMLDALSALLGDAARERAGEVPRRPVPGALKDKELSGLVAAAERVQVAREAAQGNVNPQLVLATLALELEEALCG
jgi:DNA polymerase III subunit delta'